MKNKSILVLLVLVLCCFTIKTNAQQTAKPFDFRIVNYSDKPDSNAEHYHLLSLKNTSNNTATYELSSKLADNKSTFKDVVNNQVGKIDNENTAINTPSSSSITIDFYDKSKVNKLNNITLQSNEELTFYAKFTRINNSEAGQSKYFKIIAERKKGNSGVKKSIIIRTVIPNTIIGH